MRGEVGDAEHLRKEGRRSGLQGQYQQTVAHCSETPLTEQHATQSPPHPNHMISEGWDMACNPGHVILVRRHTAHILMTGSL